LINKKVVLVIPSHRKHQHSDYTLDTVHIARAATKQTTTTCYS